MFELNDDTRRILGRPNFTCGQLAKVLRLMGHKIAEKAEAEQAAVIHWLLCLYESHGPGWSDEGLRIMREFEASLTAAPTPSPAPQQPASAGPSAAPPG